MYMKGNMNMKKILAGFLAGVFALSSATVAFAENETEDVSMLKALTMVKQRIEVPTELVNFNSSYSTYGDNKSYTFEWSTESNNDYAMLSVTIKDGIITNYDYYDKDRYSYNDGSSIGKLTMEQLTSAAKSELDRINPLIGNRIKLESSEASASLGSNNVTFPIVRVYNGIEVSNDRGRININKDTGELYSFNLNWHSNASFKKADSVISKSEAKKAYAELVGLEPVYRISYDYETDTYSTVLVYLTTDYGDINAFSGKKSNFQEDGYYDTSENPCCGEAEYDCATNDAGVKFTENELGELETNKLLLNKDSLAKILKDNKYFSYNDEMTADTFYVYSEKVNGVKTYYVRASYSLNGYSEWEAEPVAVEETTEDFAVDYSSETIEKEYLYLDVKADAQTGEILSYYFSDSKDHNVKKFSESKAKKLTEEIAKSLAGDKFSEYTLSYGNVESYQPYNSYTNTYEKSIYTGYSAFYNRYVNGIRVEGDTLSIRLNGDLTLSGYSCEYVENIEFISPNKILTVEQAFKKIWKQTDLSLNYKARTLENTTKTVLVYTIDDSVSCDALTGELLYKRVVEEKPEYSDLEGKLGEKVEQLKMYGIYFNAIDGKFSATAKVKEDELTGFFRGVGSLNNENTAAKSKTATRAYLLTQLVTSIYGSNIAELKGIFKTPYSDVSEDSEYVGYIAIAYAAGLIKAADEFKPNAAVTRGYVIELIYDYLSA